MALNLNIQKHIIEHEIIRQNTWLRNGASVYYLKGNVGIGTSSPDTLLDVEDNAVTIATIQTTATSAEYAGLNVKSPVGTWGLYTGTTSHSLIAGDFGIFDADAGVYRFVIKDDGRVGIGTTSPDSKLEVEDATSATIRSKTTGANSIPILELLNDAQDWLLRINGGDGDKFQIRDVTSNAQRLTIDTSGNVGIGTTSPTSKLQVVGLPNYANNAAAIVGGLTAGAFYYETGTDPARVCVVT